MPCDKDAHWGADGKDVQARGCLGCITLAPCGLAIDVGLTAPIARLARTIIG